MIPPWRLLVRKALSDPIADRDAAILQLDDTDGNAVEVDDQVGASLAVPIDCDLFGDGEIIFRGVIPLNQVDRRGDLSRFGFDGDAITEQVIDGVVVFVERSVGVIAIVFRVATFTFF